MADCWLSVHSSTSLSSTLQSLTRYLHTMTQPAWQSITAATHPLATIWQRARFRFSKQNQMCLLQRMCLTVLQVFEPAMNQLTNWRVC